jgi:hypothetical protein
MGATITPAAGKIDARPPDRAGHGVPKKNPGFATSAAPPLWIFCLRITLILCGGPVSGRKALPPRMRFMYNQYMEFLPQTKQKMEMRGGAAGVSRSGRGLSLRADSARRIRERRMRRAFY